jgi:hypothetical protein
MGQVSVAAVAVMLLSRMSSEVWIDGAGLRLVLRLKYLFLVKKEGAV